MAFFYFNQAITVPLEDAKGVNWIFLPAGIRIFITLVLDYSGAIGLAAASLLINYIGFYDLDLTSTLGIAIICGIAPLLGRHFVIHNLKVQVDLSNISMKQLLAIIVAYSLLSSGLHQLWFTTRGLDSGSFNHFIAMFCGDVAGSILFVAIIKYGIDLIKGRLGRDKLINRSEL
jgi:type IV secretory pathway VirB2 component (pilin)